MLLSACRFAWTDELPSSAPLNPTATPAAPSGPSAVGARLRVFWPAMGKWYAGKVTGFDRASGAHTVTYSDGDVQSLHLSSEAVVWAGVPPPSHRLARPLWPPVGPRRRCRRRGRCYSRRRALAARAWPGKRAAAAPREKRRVRSAAPRVAPPRGRGGGGGGSCCSRSRVR